MPELSDKTKETTATMVSSKPQTMAKELGGGDSSFSPKAASLLNQIYKLMVKQRDAEMKRREKELSKQESLQAEEDDREKKLIEAIRGKKEEVPKATPAKKEKAEKKEKKGKKPSEGNIGASVAGGAVIAAAASDAEKEKKKVEKEKETLVTPTKPTITKETVSTPTAQPIEPTPTVSQAPTTPVTPIKPTEPPTAPTASKIEGGKMVGGLLMPSLTYANAIDDASKTVGVDRALMYAIAKQESGFNPSAKASTSSAKGLFQFISSTWNEMVQKYGKDYPILKEKGPEDAKASAIAGALFIKENSSILSKAKIPVDATSVYAAHFLGAGGARTLFTSDPNKNAVEVLPKAAAANDFIFYGKTDKKIDKTKPRTVKEVIDVLFEKVGQYQEKYAQSFQQKNFGTEMASSSVPSTPTSSVVAVASKDNQNLKENLNKQKSTTTVNNTSSITVADSKTTQNKPTVDDRPIYLRKSVA